MTTPPICPHLNCLVYHPNGPCTCDMAKYCEQCQEQRQKESVIPAFAPPKEHEHTPNEKSLKWHPNCLTWHRPSDKCPHTPDWDKGIRAQAKLIRENVGEGKIDFSEALENGMVSIVRQTIAEAVREERERIRKEVENLPGKMLYRHSPTRDSVIETKKFVDTADILFALTNPQEKV